jgi:hypothetical protein
VTPHPLRLSTGLQARELSVLAARATSAKYTEPVSRLAPDPSAKIVRIGTFNAESYWRPSALATQPSIHDSSTAELVVAMDELLVPWGRPGSVLVTMLPVHPAQADYLVAVGLDFELRPLFASIEQWREAGKPLCAYQVAAENHAAAAWPNFPLSPYAVTQSFHALARLRGESHRWPDPLCVAQVNSKVFSTLLNRAAFPEADIVVIRSLSDLQNFAKSLSGRPFLVKDPFGLSGKGHFAVRDDAGLARLLTFLSRQMDAGCEIEFVAEALLEKSADFSCFCELSADGRITFRGVQLMLNNGFSYLGSQPADPGFLADLRRQNYCETLEPFLRAVHDQGYWGPVCIDSMLLADKRIWPVVEINARESMGSVARSIVDFLSEHGVGGLLTFLVFSARGVQPYEELLAALGNAGLLWKPGRSNGVLPLSSASVYATSGADKDAVRKGRWYAFLVAENAAACLALRERWISFCAAELGWQVFKQLHPGSS